MDPLWLSPSLHPSLQSPSFSLETPRARVPLFLSDRFIPRQLNFDTFLFRHIQQKSTSKADALSTPNVNESLRRKNSIEKYQTVLKKNLSTEPENSKIRSYAEKRSKRQDFVFDDENHSEVAEHVRTINKQPYKILEAPKLKDDFYYNILDWNKDDLIAVSLNNIVYMWTGRNNEAEKLIEGKVSSIKFCHKGVAIGDQSGVVKIIDVEKKKTIGRYLSHLGRIGTIEFNHNIMTTGSKDERVIMTDIRSNETICRLYGHKQEVCGIRWSYDGSHFASGGNDNKVLIWSSKMNREVGRLEEHTAAVKGLAWSPHKHNLLATGGGTSDKSIKMWNVQDMSLLNSVDTGSQICNMVFSENVNELLTTHGYSLNTVSIWRQKDMSRIATLHGHTYRVLYLAMSPDGESVVTGSGDETLRFWKVFPQKESERFSSSGLDVDNCVVR